MCKDPNENVTYEFILASPVVLLAQSAGAVEYTICISAEGQDTLPPYKYPGYWR